MPNIPEHLTQALADRYRIERHLGEGGMATVYLATDLKHGRQVAVKVLKPDIAAGLGAERFLREIDIAARLHHPHILALYDSGRAAGPTDRPSDELLYYVMPYVEGESLRDKLDRETQLSIDEARHIAAEVADALGAAHAQGVVHRDIKPENILLHGDHATVADFGIARAVTAAGGEGLTETGLAVGTPTYMSPEQAAGERDLDARSDLYSLGCVLHEMLMGEPPHTGPTAQAVIAKTLSEPVTSLRTVRNTIPEGLDITVLRALAKVPADRFGSAAELRNALRGETAVTRESPVPRNRRLAMAAVLAVVAVSAVAVGSWMANRRSDEPVAAAVSVRDNSIAVLPFRNASADPEQDYFAEGIAQSVLGLLSRIPELRVAAQASAFSLGDSDLTASQIGDTLGVTHLLQGSVQRAGERVRITVSLSETSSESQIWAESYNRRMADVFALQDEIAVDVVEQLQITLLGAPPQTHQTTPEAYGYFLQAQSLLNSGRPTDEEAEVLLLQTLALDGDYVPALMSLARVYHRYSGERPEYLQRSKDLVDRGMAIDPNSALGHGWLGWFAFFYERDFEAWARHTRRAIESDPRDVVMLHGLQIISRRLGQYDKAIQVGEFEVARDPLCSRCYVQLAFSYLAAGQLDTAEARYHKTALLEAGADPRIWQGLSTIEMLRADPAASLGYALRIPEDRSGRALALAIANSALGNEDEARSALEELRAVDNSARLLSRFYAWQGDHDRAFEYLVHVDPGTLNGIPEHPYYRPLRSDPRWHAWLAEYGMAPEQLAAMDLELELPESSTQR